MRKAMMEPRGLYFHRDAFLLMLGMKRQQAVHLGLNLFRRAILMHAAVGLFGIVKTFFVFAFEQFYFEKFPNWSLTAIVS